jgi:hypothetical protein
LLDKDLKEVSLNERNWPYRESCLRHDRRL